MRISTKWIITATLACMVLFAGCAAGTQNGSPNNPQPNTPGDTENKDEGQISYPREVTQTMEAIEELKVGMSIILDDKTYVIASFGRQPTAGYKAQITDVETKADKATVTVALEPPHDNAAATVVTYPQTVKVLEGRYDTIEFIKEGDYMPQIIGLEKPLKEPGYASENIMVVDYNPFTAGAAGIARVFEATVSYEIRDEDDKVLKKDFVTTASGAPDWGYFELELDELPSDSAELVLYQESAKDGSIQDEVHLPVKAAGNQ